MAIRLAHRRAGLGFLLALVCCVLATAVLRATASTLTVSGRAASSHPIARAHAVRGQLATLQR